MKKSIMKNGMIAAMLFAMMGVLTSATIDGINANETATFRVEGNCGMCKKNIENALDVKGVSSAEWNQKTKMLTVVYNPEKIQLNEIHKLVNEAGYDTDKSKAPDDVYKKLPKCCKYRDAEE